MSATVFSKLYVSCVVVAVERALCLSDLHPQCLPESKTSLPTEFAIWDESIEAAANKPRTKNAKITNGIIRQCSWLLLWFRRAQIIPAKFRSAKKPDREFRRMTCRWWWMLSSFSMDEKWRWIANAIITQVEAAVKLMTIARNAVSTPPWFLLSVIVLPSTCPRDQFIQKPMCTLSSRE